MKISKFKTYIIELYEKAKETNSKQFENNEFY